MTTKYPKWLRDISQLLTIRAQFALSGNIRDRVPVRDQNGLRLMALHGALWDALQPLDYDGLLVWDVVDGLQAYPLEHERVERLSDFCGADLSQPQPDIGLPELIPILRRINAPLPNALGTTPRVALVIDYASRLRDENHTPERARALFIAAEKAALTATPLPRPGDGSMKPMFNPVIWLANRPNDLPYWLTVDNERIRSITVSLPDADSRRDVGRALYSTLLPLPLRNSSEEAFGADLARLTHNLSVNALRDIINLATRRDVRATDIDDAVESFRIGDTTVTNPWRGEHLRKAIKRAEADLPKRVKGQSKAVTKVLDILKRTSIGLTGAQTSSSSSRPRGVLFFAGPTGVGKTEMAKAIADVVFGDESAYLRFDMSEFSAEHAGDRLIGAPPGYVGFDQGGELTSAIREQPFRVLLFDEIEKAHHRILDKFLQILEDGRLTDGRGETVYFSETLIVFTSNLGVTRKRPDGTVETMISEQDSPEEVETKIKNGVRDHFFLTLQRPELYNRIGENNIVVFNYISPEFAMQILDGMIENVLRRVREEHDVTVSLSTSVREALRRRCTGNMKLGGRGIGAELETVFVNPLARLIFDRAPQRGQTLAITQIEEHDGAFALSAD